MKILVPFDFSKESINALRLGKGMASKLKVGLKVIHSLGIPDYPYYNTKEISRFQELVMENAKTELQKELETIFTDPSEIELEISAGKPASHIIQNTQDRSTMATVLGRKQQKLPDSIGSTTRDIIRYSEDAIISVSEEFDFDHIKEMLFVTDFEPTPVDALSTIKLIQKANNANLSLLYVNTKENWQSTAETKKRMEKFCKIHGLVNAQLKIVNDESLEKGVLDLLKSTAVDLIAIKINSATGKLDIVETHLSAERIMDHTNIPVLTYSKEQFVVWNPFRVVLLVDEKPVYDSRWSWFLGGGEHRLAYSSPKGEKIPQILNWSCGIFHNIQKVIALPLFEFEWYLQRIARD